MRYTNRRLLYFTLLLTSLPLPGQAHCTTIWSQRSGRGGSRNFHLGRPVKGQANSA